MINLLPPDLKQSYRFAHLNHRLLHWVILFGIGLVGVIALGAAGTIYLQQQTSNYNAVIATSKEQLARQNLDGTQKQVKEISNNLKLVVQVLSREVLFSKLLTQLGSAMPANTILSNLNIMQTTGGLDITARATDYQAATQVQVNLSDPANKIFSNADIVSIVCQPATSGIESTYPCVVTIRALFAKDNPFLFIHNGAPPKATP